MNANTVRSLLHEVIDDKQKKEYEGTLELNTAYTLQGVGTFRISAFAKKALRRGGALHSRLRSRP